MQKYKHMVEDREIERDCSCNYHLASVLIDYDACMLECSECGHKEAIPEYALKFPEELIYEYWSSPLRFYVKESFTTVKRERMIEETFKNSFWA